MITLTFPHILRCKISIMIGPAVRQFGFEQETKNDLHV